TPRSRLRGGRAEARAPTPAHPRPRPRRVPLAAPDLALDRGRRHPRRARRPPRPRAGRGMKGALRSALISLVVLGVALPPVARHAAGQKKDRGELGDKEQALQQTQKRLKEERAKAADARKREAGLLAELEAIDRRLAEKRKQVALLDARIRRSVDEIGELQR